MRFERLVKNEFLIGFAVVLIFVKLVSNYNFFLLLFLLVIGFGIFRESLEGKIKFLLFFSTWVYVLKLEEGGFSFFHLLQLIYLISCAISMLIKRNKINIKVFLVYLLFVLYIFINFSINSSSNIFVVVGFLLNFNTVAIALSTFKRIDHFKSNVSYFAFGLATSGLIALMGEYIPQIKRNIQNIGEDFTVYQNNHLYTRFSGFDIDPNYFAFQVLFAISLLIVISSYKKNSIKENMLILTLVFMGILTLSKMFLILLVFIVMYIFAIYLKNNIVAAFKYILILLFIFLAMIPIGLLDFLMTTLLRFSLNGKSTVSITTGRSDLWINYTDEILSSPRVFFIGNGIGIDFLGGAAAHNMYLLFWYFLGLVGIITLLFFILISYNHVKKQIEVVNDNPTKGLNKLPLTILLIANLSLDAVMMDYFPLFLLLSILSCNYLGNNNHMNAKSLTDNISKKQ